MAIGSKCNCAPRALDFTIDSSSMGKNGDVGGIGDCVGTINIAVIWDHPALSITPLFD